MAASAATVGACAAGITTLTTVSPEVSSTPVEATTAAAAGGAAVGASSWARGVPTTRTRSPGRSATVGSWPGASLIPTTDWPGPGIGSAAKDVGGTGIPAGRSVTAV